jgi:hypothetical protein
MLTQFYSGVDSGRRKKSTKTEESALRKKQLVLFALEIHFLYADAFHSIPLNLLISHIHLIITLGGAWHVQNNPRNFHQTAYTLLYTPMKRSL